MTTPEEPRAVLVTGTIGSGKTAVATEMGEILEESGIPCAIVDLDWLGWVHLGRHPIDELIASNLAAMVPNYHAAGVRHYVLARSIGSAEQVAALRGGLDGATPLVVVRLTANKETILGRLRNRDEGRTLQEHVAQAVQFESEQAHAQLADFDVSTDSRSVREVATEVLSWLGWIG
jgi:adenylylsulfate kinase